ncbi:MAG: undecaprenyldiphospho-muramoylpentapeptide beta-N-acetylglucosaminyltransferase [Candidatus Eremiobacteraeota bacterium]|nr:undecaprenyldiphospho-muramoylpentapeptide beta-N-acetylglucosaminyltransferase [Candidatus Eremiobacteraeota bacterium]
MKTVFAGGGTGGHLYPAIAIANALRAADPSAHVTFYGTADRLEARIVPAAGYPLVDIPSAPLARNPLGVAAAIWKNLSGIHSAWRALAAERPDLIVASGGYVCFPVVVAARAMRSIGLLQSALVLLEINAHPGLANKLVAPFVDEVWGAYEAARASFGKRYIVTGIPVRAALNDARNREEAARRLRLDPQKRTLLVMGGSQGARSINEAVLALLKTHALPHRWQLLIVTGERDYAVMAAEQRELAGKNDFAAVAYLDDLSDAYAMADVVVSRAGASTLGELAALGLPAVLVPYPHAAQDHQRVNAQVFADAGAADVLDDADLTGETLWNAVHAAMAPERYDAMRSAARSLAPIDATSAILQRVAVLVRG